MNGTCLVLSEENNFKICTLIKLGVDAPLKSCIQLNSKLGMLVTRTSDDAINMFQLTEEMLSVRKTEVCGVQFDVTRDNFREPEEIKIAEQLTEHGSVLDDTLVKKFDQQYFEQVQQEEEKEDDQDVREDLSDCVEEEQDVLEEFAQQNQNQVEDSILKDFEELNLN